MKFENEITVKIDCSYNQLTNILKNKGFNVEREYNLKDTYMVNSNIDIEEIDEYELLSNYLMVRNVNNQEFEITHKYKEYGADGSIIKQGKTRCEVYNEEDAIKILEEIGYKKLLIINNDNKIYTRGDIMLVASKINDDYICVEYEGKEGQSIEQLIEEFEQFDIPNDKTNYFVKKALIELQKLKKERKN